MSTGPPHDSPGGPPRPGGGGSLAKTTSGNSDFHNHLFTFATARRANKLSKTTGPVNNQARNVNGNPAGASRVQQSRNAVTAGKSFATIASQKKVIEPLLIDTYADQIDPREKSRNKPSPVARNNLINRLDLQDDEFDTITVSRGGPGGFQYLIKISLKKEIDIQTRYKNNNFFKFGIGGSDAWFGRLRGVQGEQIEDEAKERSIFVRIEDELPPDVSYGLLKAALARADIVLRSKIIQSKYQKAPPNWNEDLHGKWRLEGRPDGRHHFYAVEMENFPTKVEVRKHIIRLRLPKKASDTADNESISGEDPETKEDQEDDLGNIDDSDISNLIPSMEEIEKTDYKKALDEFEGEDKKTLDEADKRLIQKWPEDCLKAFKEGKITNVNECDSFFKDEFVTRIKAVYVELDNDELEAISEYKQSIADYSEYLHEQKANDEQFKHVMFFTMFEALNRVEEVKIGKLMIEKDKNEPLTVPAQPVIQKPKCPSSALAELIYKAPDFKQHEQEYRKSDDTRTGIETLLSKLGLEQSEEAKAVVDDDRLVQSTKAKIDNMARRTAAAVLRKMVKTKKRPKEDTPEKLPENAKKTKLSQTETEENMFSDSDLNQLDRAADELIASYKLKRTPLEDHDESQNWDRDTTKYWMLRVMHEMTYKQKNTFKDFYTSYDRMCSRLFDSKNLKDGSKSALSSIEVSYALRIIGKNVKLAYLPKRPEIVSQKAKLFESLKTSTLHLREMAADIDKEYAALSIKQAEDNGQDIREFTKESSESESSSSSEFGSANSTLSNSSMSSTATLKSLENEK